jgi:hypothetical protein
MANKFAMVGCSGLVICVICLGAAAAIGGRDVANGLDFNFFSGKPECGTVAGAVASSRDLDWDGSDHVGLAVGGHATYTPGSDNKLHITGDPQTLAHLRVRGGSIERDCRAGLFNSLSDDVQITLPGRPFKKFSIAGSTDLDLHNLDQDVLEISIAGSGNVKANGKAQHVKVHIAGSGDADLGQVAMQVMEVRIAGSGDADGAPTEEADVSIAGSGDVTLHSNPKRLVQHIAGSGSVRTTANGG